MTSCIEEMKGMETKMTIQTIEDRATLCPSPPSVLAAFLNPSREALSIDELSKRTVRRMFAAVDDARKNQTDR